MWLNILSFNLNWLGLVIVGDTFIPIALLSLSIHLYFCGNFKSEIQLVTIVALIGIGLDFSLFQLGIFDFSPQQFVPAWLMVLWLCFATTIAHSLSFLSHSKWHQLIAGAIAPPLSYLAGARLSAVQFTYSIPLTLVVLSCVWALLMVLFFSIKKQIYLRSSNHV